VRYFGVAERAAGLASVTLVRQPRVVAEQEDDMAEAQADREHRALLAAAMNVELGRREAAARTPGIGYLLNTDKISYQAGAPWLEPQVGLGFGGQGHTPAPHVPPVPVHADPAVSGVPGLAAVVAPGSRRPATSQLVTTTSAPVAHRSGPQVAYVDAGPRRGLLGRIIDRLRGGRA
jgi:hypothetical protein